MNNEDSLKIVQIDPRDYFGFGACGQCDFPPCRRLLLGGWTVYGRDLLVVHHKHFNTIRPCPFAAGSFNEAEVFFKRLSIQDINRVISSLRNDLYVVETLRYPAEHYFSTWADFGEKVEYLRVLWHDRVYAMVRIPFQKDEKIRLWMEAFYDSYTGISTEEKKGDVAGVEEEPSVSGPVQLNIKEIDGPKHLAHNETCVYMIKGFSHTPTDEERKSVSWVVKLDGKEVERHEKIGEQCEFIAIGEYAGETITVHPFLRSPSDTLCIRTTVGECLLFDGKSLSWLDEDLKARKTWPATSGGVNHTDEAKDGGPIPAGKWVALRGKRLHTPDGIWWEKVTHAAELKEFGADRIGLIPFKNTETHGRKEFFIHGGAEAGSGYGIDLTDKMQGFVDEFVKDGKDLVVVVKDCGQQISEVKYDNEEFCIMVATIYGEAGNSSEAAWKAVAHVIMNRVGSHEWKIYKTPKEIITKTGFDAYTQQTNIYKKAYDYLKGNRVPTNKRIEQIANVIKPIYLKEDSDNTNSAILYFSPLAQTALHKKIPDMYPSEPYWATSPLVEECNIPGLLTNDDFKFYRYK